MVVALSLLLSIVVAPASSRSSLVGPLIGVLTTKGEAMVKQGALTAPWDDEFAGVAQLVVATDPTHGPLIGVLTTKGEAMVKQGALNAPWDDEFAGVARVNMAN